MNNGIFDRFSSALFSAIKGSRLSYYLCGGFGKSVFETSVFANNYKYKFMVPLKRKFSSLCDNSIILSKLNRVFDNLAFLSVRSIGIIYFTLGLLSAAVYLLSSTVQRTALDGTQIAIRLICTVLAGGAMISQKSLYDLLTSSKTASFVSGKLFGFDPYPSDEEPRQMPNIIAVIIGILLTVFSYFSSFGEGLLLPFMVVFIYFILKRPYVGVFAVAVLLPFIDVFELALLSAFVTFSTLLKIMSGKRSVTLSLVGVFSFGFLISVLISGIAESFSDALIYIVICLNIVNITTLFKTDRSLDKLENVIIFPGCAISVLTVISSAVSILAEKMSSSFTLDVAVIGEYSSTFLMIASLPVCISVAMRNNEKDRKIIFFGFALLMLASLYISFGVTFLIIGTAIASFACLVSFKKALSYLLGFVPAFATLIIIFGEKMNRSVVAENYLAKLIQNLPTKLLLFGGGFGRENVYNTVTIYCGENEPIMIDTWSAMISSIGLIGLLLAFFIISVSVLNSMKSIVKGKNNEERRFSVCAGTVSLLSILVCGFFLDLFTDVISTAMVMYIIGYTAAAQRLVEKYGINETDLYFGGSDD